MPHKYGHCPDMKGVLDGSIGVALQENRERKPKHISTNLLFYAYYLNLFQNLNIKFSIKIDLIFN